MGLSGLEHVVELRTLSSLLRRLSLCRFCRVHRFCRFCWLRCAKMSRLLACLQQTQSLVLHANLVSKGQHIYTHIYIYIFGSFTPSNLATSFSIRGLRWLCSTSKGRKGLQDLQCQMRLTQRPKDMISMISYDLHHALTASHKRGHERTVITN